MVFAVDGVITKVSDYNNSDKLVYMITPKGRLSVMVKGAKNPTGKKMSVSQLFSYANFEIYEKNDSYWLKSGELTEGFYELTSDIESLSLATYLCDVANEFTDEGAEDGGIMSLLLNSLYLLSKKKKPPMLVKGVFEFAVMCMSGYMPILSRCAFCGEFEAEHNYLDLSGGRVVCADCVAKRNRAVPKISSEFEYDHYSSAMSHISNSVLCALRYIESSPPNRLFSFELKGKDEMNDFSRACELYMLEHVGHGFDSLDFYKSVKDM